MHKAAPKSALSAGLDFKTRSASPAKAVADRCDPVQRFGAGYRQRDEVVTGADLQRIFKGTNRIVVLRIGFETFYLDLVFGDQHAVLRKTVEQSGVLAEVNDAAVEHIRTPPYDDAGGSTSLQVGTP